MVKKSGSSSYIERKKKTKIVEMQIFQIVNKIEIENEIEVNKKSYGIAKCHK